MDRERRCVKGGDILTESEMQEKVEKFRARLNRERYKNCKKELKIFGLDLDLSGRIVLIMNLKNIVEKTIEEEVQEYRESLKSGIIGFGGFDNTEILARFFDIYGIDYASQLDKGGEGNSEKVLEYSIGQLLRQELI